MVAGGGSGFEVGIMIIGIGVVELLLLLVVGVRLGGGGGSGGLVFGSLSEEGVIKAGIIVVVLLLLLGGGVVEIVEMGGGGGGKGSIRVEPGGGGLAVLAVFSFDPVRIGTSVVLLEVEVDFVSIGAEVVSVIRSVLGSLMEVICDDLEFAAVTHGSGGTILPDGNHAGAAPVGLGCREDACRELVPGTIA